MLRCRSLDYNHMVTTGEEGFRTQGNPNTTAGWLNAGGSLGMDFDCNTAHPEVDVRSRAAASARSCSQGSDIPDLGSCR